MTSPVEPELSAVIDGWAGRRALVVGDAMVDEWRFAAPDRISREAPAPVLRLRHRQVSAGGAANTAVNLAALGAKVTLVAPIGADAAGDELHDCLDRAGVVDRTVTVAGHRTTVKRRLLAGGQILLREDEADVDDGPQAAAGPDLLATLDAALADLGPASALLAVCDYGHGALSEPVKAWLTAHRSRFGTVALDAHDLRPWWTLAPTLVTPSLAEVALLLGRDDLTGDGVDRTVAARACLAEVRRRTGAEVAAITLDADGAIVGAARGPEHRERTQPAPRSHTVGAGDAYLAAMSLALSGGAPVPVAAHLAQLAAAVTLGDAGTCVADRAALLVAAAANHSLVEHDTLVETVRRHRARGRRVVFTNGCFDVLHRGHVRLLHQAAALGDVLVVAVNGDASVRRLKGPDRPVNPLEDRVAVLAALGCVDHVVVFAEDSPAALIEAVRPDVYVKGGDYPVELIPEAPLVRRLGGEVYALGYVPNRSTSGIIERIRAGSGA